MLWIMNIIEDTTVDGPGLRTAIYAAGCSHACPGCHNPTSWDIHNGRPMEIEEIVRRILDDPFADVTFSGGDPFYQVEGFTRLAQAIKTNSRKSIWCYTGYSFEQIMLRPKLACLLPYIDVLVDGRFVRELRDESLRFRGSSNQRLIDVPASLRQERVIVWEA
ncbi:MAG: anaerobic ribonucleoside-triphosphate reductase activating protein [Mediterranea sp.]|nr:anaerobic ribonucleoside-triphosphate reductase activating protein [Mediterranea sp.]